MPSSIFHGHLMKSSHGILTVEQNIPLVPRSYGSMQGNGIPSRNADRESGFLSTLCLPGYIQ